MLKVVVVWSFLGFLSLPGRYSALMLHCLSLFIYTTTNNEDVPIHPSPLSGNAYMQTPVGLSSRCADAQQCIAVRCISLLCTAHWRWTSIYTKYLDLGCLPSPAQRLVQLGRSPRHSKVEHQLGQQYAFGMHLGLLDADFVNQSSMETLSSTPEHAGTMHCEMCKERCLSNCCYRHARCILIYLASVLHSTLKYT